MAPSPLETTLAHYLEALRERPGVQPVLQLLRDEFLVGISGLTRYGYASRKDLFWGEPGVELLHDACTQLLAGALGATPGKGDVLRLVSRLAHARLRKESRRCVRELDPDLDIAPRLAPLPRGGLTPWARLVENIPLHQKAAGGVHLGRMARSLQVPRKRLRAELRSLGRQLGRDAPREQFWLRRLGECAIQMLRESVEERVPDLLPSRPSRDSGMRRLRRVLERLKHCEVAPAYRSALKLVRRMAKHREFPREDLRAAAVLLHPDPFPVRLADAEWLRAEGRIAEAFDALAALAHTTRPDAVSLVAPGRRSILLALVEARCLEAQAEFRLASEVLEPVASIHRRDPLVVFNRLVLAESAGLTARAAAARGDLAGLVLDRISPRLERRIRARL